MTDPSTPPSADSLALVERPQKVAAVSGKGRMVPLPGRPGRSGYQPENHQWRDQLCTRNQDGRLEGCHPATIPTDVLTASGHPPARTVNVMSRRRKMLRSDPNPNQPTRLSQIRDRECMPCSSDNRADVRRCPIYDCPCWPYRMGFNPHRPQRGKTPANFVNSQRKPPAGAKSNATNNENVK
jgi:hypothetical protein